MDEAKDSSSNPLKCYQRCDFQSETLSVTTTSYPSQNTFENRNEMCLILKKFNVICSNPLKLKIFEEFYKINDTFSNESFCNLVTLQSKYEVCTKNFTQINPERTIDAKLYKFVLSYTKENIAKIKIFFRDPYHTLIEKDVSLTFTSFLGNAGGLVGLCTGMSIVSIFEVIYFISKVFENFIKSRINQ